MILNAKQAQDSVTREKGVRRSSSDLTMVQRRSLEFVRMPCLDKRLKEDPAELLATILLKVRTSLEQTLIRPETE